jgi:hypothetical protein
MGIISILRIDSTSFFAFGRFGVECFVAFPEVLAIGAAVSHFHVSLTPVPVDFAVLIVLTPPTAVPVNFQKIAPFNFLDDQGHRHQIFFDVVSPHEFVKLFNLFISTVQVNNEDFFSKNR